MLTMVNDTRIRQKNTEPYNVSSYLGIKEIYTYGFFRQCSASSNEIVIMSKSKSWWKIIVIIIIIMKRMFFHSFGLFIHIGYTRVNTLFSRKKMKKKTFFFVAILVDTRKFAKQGGENIIAVHQKVERDGL